MPNELNIALATTGLAVTCQRYQNGAAVGSAINCPETGSTGFYSGNMTGTAGTYQLAFLAAGANVGAGSIIWDGTNEVASSTLTAPQVRTELSTELGRIDANISSRLAPSGTLATVTNLTNAPASVTPSDIWSHGSRTVTGGTVDTLTNAPSVPSAASIRAEIDSNSTQLAAIKSKTDALPASPAATGDIPSANITAIKAKTDLLVTDRLAQCSTVATTGAQLAAALS